MNLRPRHREDPEINLISMIDVLLVLLIFFMVSTTFNQEGRVKVQLLRRARSRCRGVARTLGDHGHGGRRLRVNERTLINASPDTLRTALLKEAGADRGPITIRADARTTHQAVVTAMDVAGRLGFASSTSRRCIRKARLERNPRCGLKPAGDAWSIYRRLLKYAKPYAAVFLVGVMGSILFAASNAALAYLVKNS